MINAYWKWDSVLGKRHEKKIRNNTTLVRERFGTAPRPIYLRHHNTTLFEARVDKLIIRPYASVSSRRRLSFLSDCGHYVRSARGGHHTYTNGSGDEVTKFVSEIVVTHEGVVLHTDWVAPDPWSFLRVRTKVVRAAVDASYAVWAAHPVAGCSGCNRYALEMVMSPDTPATLWAKLESVTVPACFWHSARVDRKDDLLGVWRAHMALLPLATRTKVLRQRTMRARFTKAAVAVLVAQLAGCS